MQCNTRDKIARERVKAFKQTLIGKVVPANNVLTDDWE